MDNGCSIEWLYRNFEDTVSVGSYLTGHYFEFASESSFRVAAYTNFIVAYKNIEGDSSEQELEDKLLDKLQNGAWRESFREGIKERREYMSNLCELRAALDDSKIHPVEEYERMALLAQLIVSSPWFGAIGRPVGEYCLSFEKPYIDFAAITAFYRDVKTIPNAAQCVIRSIKSVCQKIIERESRPLPLLEQRRLLLYELCDYHEEQLAVHELSLVYFAMRFASRETLIMWYMDLPLSEFAKLVARNTLTATILLVETFSSTENPEDLKLLPVQGPRIRSMTNHNGILFEANERRRKEFERETLTAKFWQNLKPIEDLEPESLKPLNLPYLLHSSFYIDCSINPLLLEMDFLAITALGKVLLGLIHNSGCMDPPMKSRLIALDSKQQQLSRGGIASIGPVFFMPYFVLEIRRDNLLDDALNKLVLAQVRRGSGSLKSPLKVKFQGEAGVDEGGVAKEFFQLLIEEVLNPDYGMFSYNEEQCLYWFLADAFGSSVQFELIGIILGLAVYNHIILDIHFPHALYKKLLSGLASLKNIRVNDPQGVMRVLDTDVSLLMQVCPPARENFDTEDHSYSRAQQMNTQQLIADMAMSLPKYEPTLEDLEELHPPVAKGLRQLLMMPAEDVEALDLTFSVTVSRFSQMITVPIYYTTEEDTAKDIANEKAEGAAQTTNDASSECPSASAADAVSSPTAAKSLGGVDLPVTGENREMYVKAVLDYYLVRSIEKEFNAFYKGFHRCCGGPALTKLTPADLHLLVCGAPGDLDFDNLALGARYVDGYTADSDQIKWFWEFAHALSPEDKKKLLFFITGSDRTPVGGLESLKLTISKAGGEVDRLPTAHTCFNHLLLPSYPDKETLERYFRIAMEYRHGFGLR